MSSVFVQEREMNKVCLKCGGFDTICPYNKELDHAEIIEICYSPKTEHSIDKERLKEFIIKDLKGREAPIEVIPLEILIHCMKDNKEWLREGREKVIHVNAVFNKKSGAKMRVEIYLKREWVS